MCKIIRVRTSQNIDPNFIREDTSFIFTSSIRHILSSENSNSTILFCIFIRFSQHFSGLVISGVWNLSLITDDHHYLISGHHCPLYPPPVLSDKECHSLPARAPSQAPAPLSSPRTLYCTVHPPPLYTLHCCSPQLPDCLPGILSEPRLSFISPGLPIK